MNPQQSELIRKEFAHINTLYFNTAYFGPSPYRAKQKVSNALFKELDPSFFPYNTWMGIPDRVRNSIGNLVGLDVEGIFHTNSVGDVISILANGYPLTKDDAVVTIDGEYPSNVLPWMLASDERGFQFEILPTFMPTAETLREKLPANTKILNLSHVAFDSGRKIDIVEVGKICREREIKFVIDCTQSLGGIALTAEELSYIDVMACSTYKWFLGPYGNAFGYFSKDVLDKVQHKRPSWITSPNSKVVYNLTKYTTDTLPGARRFDRGQSPNMLVMSCLEASLELFSEIGLDNIQKHNSETRDYFLENYPHEKYDLITPKEHMGNILSLKAKSADPVLLEAELEHNNVDVSVREGKIRLSFHLFNTKEQVDVLLRALDY